MAKKTEKIISKNNNIDPIFLPFSYEAHKENKINLMKAELSMVKCIRILETIKRLQDQKAKLKREFQLNLSANIKDIKKTLNELPSVMFEKEAKKVQKNTNIKINEFEEEIIENQMQEINTNKTAFEKELSTIQEKIKKLSAYQL